MSAEVCGSGFCDAVEPASRLQEDGDGLVNKLLARRHGRLPDLESGIDRRDATAQKRLGLGLSERPGEGVAAGRR